MCCGAVNERRPQALVVESLIPGIGTIWERLRDVEDVYHGGMDFEVSEVQIMLS